MAAMTGLSGSGLAYVFAFADAMALGGVAAGFDYPTALKIAVEALESAAAMLKAGPVRPPPRARRAGSPRPRAPPSRACGPSSAAGSRPR